MQSYVELFLLDKDKKNIVLQRAPGGNWTGVFGALKESETPLEGARRVFIENTNMPFHRWRAEASLQISNDDMHVTVFTGEAGDLDGVCVPNSVIVDVFNISDALNNNALHKTTRWLLLACLDNINADDVSAHVIYDGIHPQLEPAQGGKPDFTKGLKIGIACNDYVHFNKLVQRLRALPQNINNRFYCVLSTTNIYGLTFDFYFKHERDGALSSGAENAVYVMGVRGMKENRELFTQLIAPAYE